MITEDEINSVVDSVKANKMATFSAAYQLGLGKNKLEDAKAVAIVNGIEGKNVAERDANLRLLLEDKYNNFALLQEDYDEARHNADLSELDLTRITLTIRLMELAK